MHKSADKIARSRIGTSATKERLEYLTESLNVSERIKKLFHNPRKKTGKGQSLPSQNLPKPKVKSTKGHKNDFYNIQVVIGGKTVNLKFSRSEVSKSFTDQFPYLKK
jgi:hypothetical protein